MRKNIALFMGIMENDFSAAILDGAVKGARDLDANLVVFPMDLIDAIYCDKEINIYRYQYNVLGAFLRDKAIDGIIMEYGTIVSMLDPEKKKRFLAMLEGLPIILLSEEADGHTCITVDNAHGLEEVINHLILEHHYTKIGYVSGPENNSDARERLQVYKQTMEKNHLHPDEDWIAYGDFSIYSEYVAKDLIQRHPDMEAIVCANDSMALGAANAMRSLGLEPGKDMFVTGFDDIAGGFLHNPALTTVKADPMALSYRAMEILCGVIPNEGNVKIKTQMIKRESCGCHGFVPNESWKQRIGLCDDWRETGKYLFAEADSRRSLEHELCNVTREMVFAQNTEQERYSSILSTLKRLKFDGCCMFLYDEFIIHHTGEIWTLPDHVNLVGAYSEVDGGINHTYVNGELQLPTEEMITELLSDDGNRHEIVILPLFFGARQIGLFVVESDPKKYLYALDMAGQISNTLYIIAMNEEQKRMKNELEEASRSKSQFLANMSHEIRTPINAIVGFNEMILRENKDASIEEYATDVKSAAGALLLLVNDVLDFSKIEAGKMELVVDDYSLPSLLENVVGMMTTKAEGKGLALYLECDKKLPKILNGDAGRIQQILINLLSNAVKYTERGSVVLSAQEFIPDTLAGGSAKEIISDSLAGGSEKDTISNSLAGGSAKEIISDTLAAGSVQDIYIRFSVKDTGIGIKQEDISRLFNQFERIEEKRNRNIEGTGLGINITTGLLALMDSTLQVTSTYGEGSEFSFVIKQSIVSWEDYESEPADLAKKSEKAPNAYEHFEAPGARILVVDDNRMNRKVITSLLKETKVIVEQAESGAECIKMVKENDYHMILLDHMMPEMDGIETLQKMLTEGIIDTSKVPVVALTANAIVGAKEMYLENGFTDYLSKPVLPKDLYAMMSQYLPIK